MNSTVTDISLPATISPWVCKTSKDNTPQADNNKMLRSEIWKFTQIVGLLARREKNGNGAHKKQHETEKA